MIRIGIGGWTYRPWRGTFYPDDLRQKDELAHAAERLGSIEINGTFYRAQSPESFAKWRDETPEGFVFSVKGHRAVVSKKVLAEAGDSLGWFLGSGVLELGDRLGPLFWQLPPWKRWDDDVRAFLDLLPAEHGGRALRHAIEAPHESFRDPEFLAALHQRNIALVTVHSGKHWIAADQPADFAYLRLEGTAEDIETGYPPEALDQWAGRLKTWEAGGTPDDLDRVADLAAPASREVFCYMIGGAKVRNPAAATALIERLA